MHTWSLIYHHPSVWIGWKTSWKTVSSAEASDGSRLLSLAREILPRQAGVGLLAEVIPIEDGRPLRWNHQPSTINHPLIQRTSPPTRWPKIPSRAKEKDPNLDPLFLRPARARALLSRGVNLWKYRIMVRTWTRFYMCRYTYRYPSICLPGYLSSIAAIDICIYKDIDLKSAY